MIVPKTNGGLKKMDMNLSLIMGYCGWKKMNEQIKKLWDQSKTSGVHPQFGEYDMYSAETFANLIVQECAEFARQHNLEHAERSHMIHKAIKEHFGVTEWTNELKNSRSKPETST